jgi:hypothetical protein
LHVVEQGGLQNIEVPARDAIVLALNAKEGGEGP